MKNLLRTYFWIVPLPLVAVAAALNAQAVAQLVGLELTPSASDLARPPPVSLRTQTKPPPRAVDDEATLLKRNPFDHVTGSLVPESASAEAETTASTGPLDTHDPKSAPVCEGVDVDAIVASDDDDWSFASLAGADHKHHFVRRQSDFGTKKVYFIGWDRVWLSGEGALCQVELMGAKKPAPPPPVASAAPAVNSRAKPLDADMKKGIQQISPTEFNIDRGVVDKILENQADLMRQARIVPVQKNGKVTGIRLNGVRPDALLGVLGMQNADELQTINGFEMGSPEKALEAYARLRTADKLTIQLSRGGKTVNLDYNIK